MKMTNEFKTGAVVIAAIAIGSLFWLKTVNLTPSAYRLKTHFNFAEGIKPDSIVKLAGVDVGRVESIKFLYNPDTKVELTLLVDGKAKVHEDSVVFISSSGLVGDAFIGITSGSADKPFVKGGALLTSEDPADMRKFWKKAEAIADSLDSTLSAIRGIAKDNKPRIDSIVVNLEQTAINFKDFSEDIKRHPWKLLSKGK